MRIGIRRLFCAFLAFVVSVLPLCGCSENEKVTDEMFALDTIISFAFYDDDAEKAKDVIKKCKDEITRLDKLLSATKEGSDVYKINESGNNGVLVSDETYELLKRANELSKSCDGTFDVSIYPLVKLWGFDSKNYAVPPQNDIDSALSYVNYSDIKLKENNCVKLKKGMSIDLGAIAKGYIGDKLRSIMKSEKLKRGIINLGGMVILYDSESDSESFNVGVEYPDTGEVFLTLSTKEDFIVTSGAYQRYFEENSKRYHHIIDPFSGKPSESDISSITVIGQDAVANDALSTAFFVMGIDKTLEYIKTNKDSFEELYSVVILNDEKDELYISSDLAKSGYELNNVYEDKIKVNVI